MHIINLFKNAVKEEARYKINLLGGVLALLTLYSLQLVFFDVISSFVPADEINGNWLMIFFYVICIGRLVCEFFQLSNHRLLSTTDARETGSFAGSTY